MKFGKVEDISGIDFEIGHLDLDDQAFLKNVSHKLDHWINKGLKFYFGETGWGNPEWKGTLYPHKGVSKDFLRYYGNQFNSIELNTTHYRIPDLATINRWKEMVPADFKFAVKFVQLVSHRRDWGFSSGAFVQFTETLHQFGRTLGLAFIQLPTYAKFQDLLSIERLVQELDPTLPVGLELRDPSFYTQEAVAQLKELFRSKLITWVVTDTAGAREIVRPHACSAKLMVRFVGCGNPKIDQQRLDQWMDRIRRMADCGLEEVFFYLHQPDHYNPGYLSLYLWRLVGAQDHWISRGPNLLPGLPEQTKLFE